MKKIFLILDGIADRRQAQLDNKTPLEYADTPNLDRLFAMSQAGCIQTIPEGEEVGSAVANLNLLGFKSSDVYKGRAVIEAAAHDIPIDKNNLYIRCNFVHFEGDTFETGKIASYSAYDIKTELSKPLNERLNKELFKSDMRLISMGSFRNILVVNNCIQDYDLLDFAPPHDIINQPISQFLQGNETEQKYYSYLKKAYEILLIDNDTEANGIWFWGSSIVPVIEDENSHKKVILAETLLMNGIARLAKIKCVKTPEDNGFEQFLKDKLNNVIDAIESDSDFIYIHVQETDDLSHDLMPERKAHAISMIDKILVGGLISKLKEDYLLFVASDHYTYSDTGKHDSLPSPFIFYRGDEVVKNRHNKFSEENCIDINKVITPQFLHTEMLKD